MDELRRKADEEAKTQVDWRSIELEAVKELLAADGLRAFDIAPDGHCLYSAIAHQLNRGNGAVTVADGKQGETYHTVRQRAAEFMLAHPEDFLPFIEIDSVEDASVLDQDRYAAYCQQVATSAAWGGQVELQALARALERCIHVYQMGMPMLKVGETTARKDSKPLNVAYYRHSYGLGEHYNSTVPLHETDS
jgi:OTU domain-containing protein 6